MSADKRRTPPAGNLVAPEHVRAQTAGPVVWDEQTDPNLPVMEQINQRTHKQSIASVAVIERLGSLEKGHAELVQDVKAQGLTLKGVEIAVARGDGKLDTLVEAATYDKLAREEKAKAEALAEAAETKRTHELKTMRLGMRVALVTAIFAGVAAVIGAFAWIAKMIGRP